MGLLINPHRFAAAGGGGYAATVLADSPLAYYRLGESSGTTMADSSGNGRNGTYYRTPTLGATGLLAGDTDTSVDFSADYAEVGYAAWMNTTAFTVEALVRPDATSGYRAIVTRDGYTNRGWNLYLLDGKLHVYNYPPGAVLTGATTLAVGTTYHVVLTSDGTTVRLFVNGVEDASVTVALSNSPGTNLMIGASYAGTSTATLEFDGRIDEVAYYGTALSGARVAAHSAAAA